MIVSDEAKSRGDRTRKMSWRRQIVPGAIALAAILLAVWEGFENRRHNRLSVVPNVDASRDFDMRAQTFDFGLLSSGLGPAVVHDLRIFIDDRRVYDKHTEHEFAWTEAYPLLRGKDLDIWDSYYIEGQYLIPGERYELLRVKPRASENSIQGENRIDNFRELANRISVVICYCSVYGDQCATETLGVQEVDEGSCP